MPCAPAYIATKSSSVRPRDSRSVGSGLAGVANSDSSTQL